MDPDRHLPIPGHKHPPAMMPPSAPNPQARPIASSATTYQPSLPSIRQLHPFLAPSGATQPHLPAQDSLSYGYAPPGGYAGPSGSTDFHPSQSIPPRGTVHHRSDSEHEGEVEQPGPAKKKRRRQALSCNECKRRKIKCDRAQPCGPCTRRGEQSKCQWRTLEPVDKYVTRAEHEELKSQCDQLNARVKQLEAFVSRITSTSPAPVSLPLYSMSSDMPGAPPPESMSYPTAHASSSGPVLYSPALPPPSSYPTDPTPKPPHYPSRSPHLVTSAALPSSTSPQPPGGAPGHARRTSTSETKSPTTVRQSPLSITSITSPFNTEQPKNCHAQTPHMPGGRLRPVPPHLPPRRDGPATSRCDMATRHRRWALRTPWRLPWGYIYPDRRRAGGMANRA